MPIHAAILLPVFNGSSMNSPPKVLPMKLNRLIVTTSLLIALTAIAHAAGAYRVTHTWQLGVSGGWDYLTMDSTTHTLYIAQGDKVLLFDTKSNTVAATIPGLGRTHGIVLSTDGKTVYVADSATGKVHIIDHASLKETGSISVGAGADSMVIEPVTGHLFVFCGKSKEADVLDLATNTVVAQIPLPGRPEFPAADGVGGVYDNMEDLHQLVHIDAAQNKIIGSVTFDGCEGPSGQAIDRATMRAFSVCDNGRMVITELPRLKQIGMVTIGEGPDAAVFDPAQKLIFSSNGDVGTLSIVHEISPKQFELEQTVKTAPRGRTLALDRDSGAIYIVAPDPAAAADVKSKPLLLIEVSR